MRKTQIQRTAASLLLACMGFAVAGCERLGGPVATDGLAAIPAAYGELKAVTPDQTQPFASVLWFEQSDKTIMAVRVNFVRGTISSTTVKFPRN